MAGAPDGIRIALICGSVRPSNSSMKALRVLEATLNGSPSVRTDVIDPVAMELPLPGVGSATQSVKRMKETVAGATGVLFVTPEYHGSFSSVTKLIVDNLGYPSALAGKPVALVGVAAGVIGAIKALEHLRSVLSHVGAIVLPGPVSIARVRTVFDDEGRCLDERVEQSLNGVAERLVEYIGDAVCPTVCLEEVVREEAARKS